MLAIRMQRTGRKGHAMFRVVVQDSRLTPTSGKLVAALGSYDPHGKTIILDKEKAKFYLDHGAQPSERVARLLKSEGVKLPDWVQLSADKERTVRNADKRRSTRPDEPEAPVEESAPEPTAPSEEAPAESAETTAEETSVEESAPAEDAEKSADEPETKDEIPADEPVKEDEPAEAETEPEDKKDK